MFATLPPLQKEIIVNLAITGPSTINVIAKKLKKDYKSVHTSWQTLKEKKIIVPIGKMSYRNREFDTYWLTTYGVFISILHDAPAMIVFTKAEELYSEILEDSFKNPLLDFGTRNMEELSQWFGFYRELSERLGHDQFKSFTKGWVAYEEGRFRLSDLNFDPRFIKETIIASQNYPLVSKSLKSTMNKFVKEIVTYYEDLGKKL